jgi:hypothetical protein
VSASQIRITSSKRAKERARTGYKKKATANLAEEIEIRNE